MKYDISKVTPRPWNGNPGRPCEMNEAWSDAFGCVGLFPVRQDMEHAVHCVNHHEALVNLLREMLCIIDVNAPNTFENSRHCKKARALLASIKE